MFQHGIHVAGGFQNVEVLDILSLFLYGFTSRAGMRSRAFAENQYVVRHLLLLRGFVEVSALLGRIGVAAV